MLLFVFSIRLPFIVKAKGGYYRAKCRICKPHKILFTHASILWSKLEANSEKNRPAYDAKPVALENAQRPASHPQLFQSVRKTLRSLSISHTGFVADAFLRCKAACHA